MLSFQLSNLLRWLINCNNLLVYAFFILVVVLFSCRYPIRFILKYHLSKNEKTNTMTETRYASVWSGGWTRSWFPTVQKLNCLLFSTNNKSKQTTFDHEMTGNNATYTNVTYTNATYTGFEVNNLIRHFCSIVKYYISLWNAIITCDS